MNKNESNWKEGFLERVSNKIKYKGIKLGGI